jgi:hypothetical protein
MKIKLLMTINVPPKHGLTRDRILEVLETENKGIWVMGDAGEEIRIYRSEFVYWKPDDIQSS